MGKWQIIKNIISILLLVPLKLFPKIDYYTPQNIYKFADFLFKSSEYERAITEFQRYLIYSKKDAKLVYYKLGICYRYNNKISKSTEYFKKIVLNNSDKDLTEKSLLQIAYNYFLDKKYNKSNSFIQEKLNYIESKEIRRNMNYLKIINYIKLEKDKDIKNLINKIELHEKDDFLSIIKEYNNLPLKSHFLAGILSSLIPGAGKVYANRFWDGVSSLTIVTLTAWQAYIGFSQEGTSSVKGWIFGSLSAIFYLGNIYGSIVAVKIYNENIKRKYFKRLEALVNVKFNF